MSAYSDRIGLSIETGSAAFHAYGLDKKETRFVLDDSHRVQNPRVIDDGYFENGEGKVFGTKQLDRERPKERASFFVQIFARSRY